MLALLSPHPGAVTYGTWSGDRPKLEPTADAPAVAGRFGGEGEEANRRFRYTAALGR